MDFVSIDFILYFLPAFLLLYLLVPGRGKNAVLFVGSCIFYVQGEPFYAWLLPVSILINYVFSRRLRKSLNGREEKGKGAEKGKGEEKDKGTEKGKAWDGGRRLLCFVVLLNLCVLGCFKFWGYGIPLGLSFYTFQVISYFVDLYRGEIPPEDSIWRFALYLGMFPKIGAGPITSYKEIGKEIKERTISSENVQEGLGKLILGLVFKTQLADRLGALWNDLAVAGYESITWRYAWLGAVAFSLKLYFDFQGYSLMAIGLGQMLGFHLPENFRTPYLARSVRDFYRRWHATLGLWFRKYVYFPLGGSKRGEGRTILNLLAVWLLTGIWHGNTVNFLLWGIFLWCCIVLERLLEKIPFVKKMKVLPHLYLWFVIPISWMFFAITDVTQLQLFLCRMFGIGEAINENIMDWWVQLRRYGWILALGIFGASGLPEYACRKWKNNPIFNLVLAALFWLCVWSIMRQGSNPFQYLTF